MAHEEAHRDQMDQHHQQMVDIESHLKCTVDLIAATTKQNSTLTAQMTGLWATTEALASAARNNINDLRAPMIPDLCNATSTLMSEVKGLHGRLMSSDGILASQTQTLVDSMPRTCDNKIPNTTCTATPDNTFPPLAPAAPPAMPPMPTSTTRLMDMVPRMTHRSDQSWYQNSANQHFYNPAGLPCNDHFCKDCTPLAGLSTAAQNNPTSMAYGSFCPPRVTTKDGGLPSHMMGGGITSPHLTDKERQAHLHHLSCHDIAALASTAYHSGRHGILDPFLSFIHACGYTTFSTEHADDVFLCYNTIQLLHRKVL
jgi:hypothetical protein